MFMLLFSFLIILGLANAVFVSWQKKMLSMFNRPIHCLGKDSCQIVLNSKYASTFGISNDLLGIFYYIVIFIEVELNKSSSLLLLLTVLAMIFSVRLLYIQVYIIKEWCGWCLISIATNVLIFFTVLFHALHF